MNNLWDQVRYIINITVLGALFLHLKQQLSSLLDPYILVFLLKDGILVGWARMALLALSEVDHVYNSRLVFDIVLSWHLLSHVRLYGPAIANQLSIDEHCLKELGALHARNPTRRWLVVRAVVVSCTDCTFVSPSIV